MIVMKTILTARLYNDTPVFLGGYDTLYERDDVSEGLRTQSLKGLIRYWMRVYYATQGYGLNKISEGVNSILGGKKGKELVTSRVALKCYTQKEEIKKIKSVQQELKKIPRIKLLLLDKTNININYATKLNAELRLYERGDLKENEKKLVIGSLVTGLLLSGLGKMSRRGFGCFSIEINEDTTRIFRGLLNDIFSNNNLEIKAERIKEILTITMNSIEKYSGITDSTIPPIHSFSNCKIYLVKLDPTKNDVIDHICSLQRFTLRKSHNDINRRFLWFLGLPRSQHNTGYSLPSSNESARRASPLFISVHKNFAIVSLFKSRDHYDKLRWSNTRESRDINIDVNRAFEEIDNALNQYLCRNYKEVRPIAL